jgi:hypothetical protein
MPSKGLTAKIVQRKGLREGVEAGIVVFARECVDWFGRSRTITDFLWAAAGSRSGPVGHDAGLCLALS